MTACLKQNRERRKEEKKNITELHLEFAGVENGRGKAEEQETLESAFYPLS